MFVGYFVVGTAHCVVRQRSEQLPATVLTFVHDCHSSCSVEELPLCQIIFRIDIQLSVRITTCAQYAPMNLLASFGPTYVPLVHNMHHLSPKLCHPPPPAHQILSKFSHCRPFIGPNTFSPNSCASITNLHPPVRVLYHYSYSVSHRLGSPQRDLLEGRR